MSIDRILAVVWKECREAVQFDEGFHSTGLRFVGVILFGVLLSWRLGSDYGHDWSTVGVLAQLAMFAALPMTPDSFAGERERHTLETLLATSVTTGEVFIGKYAAIVGLALVVVCANAATGVVFALLRFGPDALSIDGTMIVAGIVIGTLAAAVVGGITILISVRSPSVRSASQRSAYILVAILLAGSAGVRNLPADWRRGLAGLGQGLAGTPVTVQVLAIAFVLAALATGICILGSILFGRLPQVSSRA